MQVCEILKMRNYRSTVVSDIGSSKFRMPFGKNIYICFDNNENIDSKQ